MDNLEFKTLTGEKCRNGGSIMEDINTILAGQKNFFDSGQTRDVGFRAAQLDTLHSVIRDNQKDILNALRQDLSKSAYEAYLTEVGIVLDEKSILRRYSRLDAPLRYPPYGNKLRILRKFMR
jgi:aldehyde dehydrogenase (NAD+)